MTATVKARMLEDLSVGESVERSFTVTEADVMAFAAVSHDHNPIHVDEAYAAQTPLKGRIAHGMLAAAYISAVLGADLPGPGAVYVSQAVRFKRPVRIGDTLVIKVAITEIVLRSGKVTLSTNGYVDGKLVIEGHAEALPPRAPKGAA